MFVVKYNDVVIKNNAQTNGGIIIMKTNELLEGLSTRLCKRMEQHFADLDMIKSVELVKTNTDEYHVLIKGADDSVSKAICNDEGYSMSFEVFMSEKVYTHIKEFIDSELSTLIIEDEDNIPNF